VDKGSLPASAPPGSIASRLEPIVRPRRGAAGSGESGEWTINGFRNRDVRALLYPAKAMNNRIQRKLSERTRRQLLLLRVHGLIAKVSHTHRYIVTDKGRATITALLAARQADVTQLSQMAA